jgi:hypothetical protein
MSLAIANDTANVRNPRHHTEQQGSCALKGIADETVGAGPVPGYQEKDVLIRVLLHGLSD